MSASSPDDDEQPDVDRVDCYTNYVIVEIYAPDSNVPALTEDFEIISDRPLTFNEIWARTQLQMRRWLETLAASPRFRQRFGSAPRVEVIGFGSVRGC